MNDPILLPAGWLLWLSSWCPLARLCQVKQHTSLIHACCWALAAWLAWGGLLAGLAFDLRSLTALRYLAICMTGCAGVAVLGARRPGASAWNFVVLGLLAVLLLGLAENYFLGTGLQPGVVRGVFLSATLAVGILNYLPTRLALAALLLGVGGGLELFELIKPGQTPAWARSPFPEMLVLCVPWTAWLSTRWQRQAILAFDQVWLDFRNGYGLVWGQRVREQFNRSAAHGQLPVELGWSGLRGHAGPPDAATHNGCQEILSALLKRFGPGDASSE